MSHRRLHFCSGLLRPLALACTLALCPAQGWAADVFRGELYCRNIAVLYTQPSVVDVTVTIDGTDVAYQRDDTRRSSATVSLFERGRGTLTGARTSIISSAYAEAFQVTSSYQAELTDDVLVLKGVQSWTGTGLSAPATRECDARLERRT